MTNESKLIKLLSTTEELINELKSNMSIKEALANPILKQEIKLRMQEFDTASMIALKLKEEADDEIFYDDGIEFEFDGFFEEEEFDEFDNHTQYLPEEIDEDYMNDKMEEWEKETTNSQPFKTGLDALLNFGSSFQQNISTLNTKKQSYERTIPTATILHNRIRVILKTDPDLTRRELAQRAKISLSSTCARVSELMKNGEVEVSGKKYDSKTDRNVQTLRMVK